MRSSGGTRRRTVRSTPFVRKPFCIFIYFLAFAAALADKTSLGKMCNKTCNRNWAPENIINIILCIEVQQVAVIWVVVRDGDGDEWRRAVVVAVYNRYHTATAEREFTIFI